MNNAFLLTSTTAALSLAIALAACTSQEQAASKPTPPSAPAVKAEAKTDAPAKAKATKVAGDVGLLDTEKNYIIIVTKEGKLLTLDFNQKTKVTQVTPTP